MQTVARDTSVKNGTFNRVAYSVISRARCKQRS